jgi:hypothetical protein
MNLATSLGVYATLCKEKGWPFMFPGTSKSMNQLYDASSVDLVADQMLWAADEKNSNAANQAFNSVNGDCYRWIYLWPKIAEYFGLECALPHGVTTPWKLEQNLASVTEEDWQAIIQKHHLKDTKLKNLATWDFVDFCTNLDYDSVTDSNKSYEAGFVERANTEKTYLNVFEKMKKANVIPSYKAPPHLIPSTK